MKISIPKQNNFDVPEGKYRARLTDVIELKDEVRLRFEIQISDQKYLAGKNYEPLLKSGSELRNDLDSWGCINFAEGEELDLDALIGKEADLEIQHKHNEGYNKPYV